jgi:hypothetical protein
MTNQLHQYIQLDEHEVVQFHSKAHRHHSVSTIKGMITLTLLWNLLTWIMLFTISLNNNADGSMSSTKFISQQLQPWKGHFIDGGFYFLMFCGAIGFWLIYHTFTMAKIDGPIFIGTNKRLVIVTHKEATSYHWSMFQTNPLKNSNYLTLKLIIGKFDSRDNGSEVFHYSTIEIVEIAQIDTIYQICLQRINEFAPTQR